jgi:hypothetical protein
MNIFVVQPSEANKGRWIIKNGNETGTKEKEICGKNKNTVGGLNQDECCKQRQDMARSDRLAAMATQKMIKVFVACLALARGM